MIFAKRLLSGAVYYLKRLSLLIGTVVSAVLLTLIYVVGVGATKLLAVIFKKKFLPLKDKTSRTFWYERTAPAPDLKSAERQF
jgi:hypothetical protein